MLAISDLNKTSKQEFLKTVNTLFETAPPLADLLYSNRPFASYQSLIEFARDSCLTSKKFTREQLLEIINAHPRIGAPKTDLSAMSLREQGYTTTTAPVSEDEEVNKQLNVLNDDYEKRFGFKFVVFVNGRPRKALIPVILERLNGTPEAELQTGLEAMMDIAHDRLKKLVK